MSASVQWVFGAFRLDPMNRCLWHEAVAVALKPKTFTVLQYLVEHAGQLVTKAALLDAVWPETAVSDVVLKVCIADLRKALGDRVRTPQFIATVHRYGYRFVAPVTPVAASVSLPRVLPSAASSATVSRAGVSSASRRPERPLVERDAALARLHATWAQARQGQRQVVFVTGEAGIGKTALVDAFVSQVEATSGVWLGQGQCVEHYGTGEAYLPMLELLGHLCQAPPGERLVSLVRQQAPTWFAQMPWLLTAEDRQRLHDELHGSTRDRMVREFATLVETLTVDTPWLLVLEELHWSDYATLDLLAFLGRRATPARLLILGTYRPLEVRLHEHPLQAVVYGLQRQGQALTIPLSSLSREAVARYLAARFPAHHFPVGFAGWLQQHTEGIPLFLVTLIASLVARGVIVEQAGSWQLTTTLAALGLEVPEGLRPLLEQQLTRLPPAALRVVEVASLAGVEFAAPTVAAALETEVERVEALCDALVRQELLRPVGLTTWPDGTPVMQYAFVHALYQYVAAERLGDGAKRRVHQQIGRRLETAYGTQAGEIAAALAMHFLRGHDLERAVQYLHAAAEQALHRYATAEAVEYLTTGLAVLTALPQACAHQQAELAMRMLLGSALIALQGYAAPAVEQTYTRARLLGQQVGTPHQVCGIAFGLWNCAFVRAEHQTAQALGASLLAQAQPPADALVQLAGYFASGVSLASGGALAAAREHLQQGVACATPSQHPRSLALFGIDLGVFCHAWLSHVLWLLGYARQALARSEEARAQAQALGHPFSQMLALDYAALLHQLRGEPGDVYAQAQEALRLGTEKAFAYYSSWALMFHGWALTAHQQREEGIRQMQEGLTALQATGGAVRLPYYWALLAEAYGQTGRVVEGHRLVAQALAHIDATGETWYAAALHRLQGELLLAQSQEQHGAAHACFQQALTVARRQQAKALELRAAMSLARLWQQQGKRAEARELLAPLYGWFTEGFDTADLQEAKALLDELGG